MADFHTPVSFNAHFMVTTYCNAFCPHCHVSAGPHQQKQFIPLDDVMFYLDTFKRDSKFGGLVGLNGGEAVTAYKHYSPDYIPTIIQECVKNNWRVDLRTNSLWTEDNTINDVIWRSLDNIDFTGYTNKISFSLSIDKYHNNESANQKLIARVCNSDLGKHSFLTAYVIPDGLEQTQSWKDAYARLFSLLSDKYVEDNKLECKIIKREELPPRFDDGIVLNNVPFLVEVHNIGQWGRAKENGIGKQDDWKKHVASQLMVLDHTADKNKLDPNVCVKGSSARLSTVFNSDGTFDFCVPVENITPGVQYHTADGKCKPWEHLYNEMVALLDVRFNALKKLYPHITRESVGLNKVMEVLQRTK